jgi:hypothetical protein
MPKPTRGWLELQSAFVSTKLPKFFLDPRWAILIGALLTFVGRSELQLRSIGFLLIAIWLIVDLWAWNLKKKVESDSLRLWASAKFGVGWSGTSLLLIGVMITIWWGLSVQIADQQEDSYQHLTGAVYLPPSGNPIYSIFTITNGGRTDIADHTLLCRINFAVFGTIVVDEGKKWIRSQLPQPLRSGGDAESDSCLTGFISDRDLSCADITFSYEYSLVSQPSTFNSKSFRFITTSFAGKIGWYPQPISTPKSPCETEDVALPDTSHYRKVTVCSSGCNFTTLSEAAANTPCGTFIYMDRALLPVFDKKIEKACDAANWFIVKFSDNPRLDVPQ